jgi:hypothetical protein
VTRNRRRAPLGPSSRGSLSESAKGTARRRLPSERHAAHGAAARHGTLANVNGETAHRPSSSLLRKSRFSQQALARKCRPTRAPRGCWTYPASRLCSSVHHWLRDTTDTPPDQDIPTDWCEKNCVRWRVYHGGFSFTNRRLSCGRCKTAHRVRTSSSSRRG